MCLKSLCPLPAFYHFLLILLCLGRSWAKHTGKEGPLKKKKRKEKRKVPYRSQIVSSTHPRGSYENCWHSTEKKKKPKGIARPNTLEKSISGRNLIIFDPYHDFFLTLKKKFKVPKYHLCIIYTPCCMFNTWRRLCFSHMLSRWMKNRKTWKILKELE